MAWSIELCTRKTIADQYEKIKLGRASIMSPHLKNIDGELACAEENY
jgi:hypothetical protein